MPAIGRQPRRRKVTPLSTTEYHPPERTTLYRLEQRHAQTSLAQAEEATGASLPQFVNNEFDAFLECGVLTHGFARLRCAAGSCISARLAC